MNSVTLFACVGETKTLAMSWRVLVPNFQAEYVCFCDELCRATAPGAEYCPGPGTGAAERRCIATG